MRIASFVIALGVLALSATKVAAQTCYGDASFSAGPVRLGADVRAREGVKDYGVDVAVGARTGLFASAGISRAEFSDIDGSATVFGLSAGYAFDLNHARTVQFCPYVDLSHESLPDIDVGSSMLKSSVDAVGFGGSIGGTVRVGPSFDLVPFVGATYFVERFRARWNGETDSESDRLGVIDVGTGFVINKVLTLQPAVSIPVGIEGGKSAVGLAIKYNFGSSKP